MSVNQDLDTIVALPSSEAPILPMAAPEESQPPQSAGAKGSSEGGRGRPWVLPVAIGVSGLVVCGALGALFWSTVGQRDAARHQLSVAQSGLAASQKQLRALRSDAAANKAVADYVRLYVTHSGKVLTDYESTVACNSYGECRTVSQQLLEELQAFQADRGAAAVPAALTSSDGMLRDALSAAAAADQELIAGGDSNDTNKVKDGFTKLDDAMLAVGKAESALAADLK